MRPETISTVDAEALAKACVEVCEEHKAENIFLFDVRKSSVLADFYLICSATSEPHVRALRNRLTQALAEPGRPPRLEGDASSNWVVVDFGPVLVHILSQDLRDYYKLEELWNADEIVYRGGAEPTVRPRRRLAGLVRRPSGRRGEM